MKKSERNWVSADFRFNRVLLNPGASLAEANRVGRDAERLIREVPEVTQVGRRTGRAELDEHAEGVHYSVSSR